LIPIKEYGIPSGYLLMKVPETHASSGHQKTGGLAWGLKSCMIAWEMFSFHASGRSAGRDRGFRSDDRRLPRCFDVNR
jgi:hypothetical protein